MGNQEVNMKTFSTDFKILNVYMRFYIRHNQPVYLCSEWVWGFGCELVTEVGSGIGGLLVTVVEVVVELVLVGVLCAFFPFSKSVFE